MQEKRCAIKTNWAKDDAKQGVSNDDIPELTEEVLDRAVFSVAGFAIPMPRKRGCPVRSGEKQAIKGRIDKDILAALRATGPGWQTRINDVLRRGMKRL